MSTTREAQPERLTRHLAADLLWWAGWFALSFLVGWDITDQLTSVWFWLVAAVCVAMSVMRWRRLVDVGVHRDSSATPVGGHHGSAEKRGHRTQRGMVIYFGVALLVLIVATNSAGPDIADGRSEHPVEPSRPPWI